MKCVEEYKHQRTLDFQFVENVCYEDVGMVSSFCIKMHLYFKKSFSTNFGNYLNIV